MASIRRIDFFVVLLAGVVAASSFAAAVPAAAREQPRQTHRVFYERTLPAARALAAGAEQVGDSHNYYFVQPIHDLDGDGIGDVIVQVYDITSAPVDVRFTSSTGSLTAYALSGRTGRELWSRTEDYADGSAGVMPLRVGEDATNGVVVFKVEGGTAAYTIELNALDGSGEQLWSQTVTSSYNFYTGAGLFTPAGAATDAPTTFHRFNGVEGSAQDLLLAVSDYVVSRGGQQVGTTEAKAIDGVDGSVVDYGISATSTEMVPYADAIADVTGDGLDDVVMLTKESGRDLVVAYDSSDSSELWQLETRFSDYVWTRRMPDLAGDSKRDFVVAFQRGNRHVFHVVDAGRGRVAWSGRAWAPYPIGRADRDRRQDVGGFGFVSERRRQGTRFLVFSSGGRRLYSRVHESDVSSCRRNCILFSFLLQAGDLNGDAVKDRYVTQWLVGGQSRSRNDYVVSGRTGRKLYRRKLIPLLGNVDGRGAGDLATLSRKNGGLLLRTLTGKGARLVWRSRVRWPGFTRPAFPLQPYGAALQLDRDGCDDVLLMARTGRGAVLTALDGRTGKPKWSSGMGDDRTPKVVRRRPGRTSC